MEETECPIWKTQARTPSTTIRDGRYIDSPRAGGRYFISGSAAACIENGAELDDTVKAKLTTWLIDQRALGVEFPEIRAKKIDEVKQFPVLSVVERGERLLHYFNKMLGTIGERYSLKIKGSDYNLLAVSESIKMTEVSYLLEYLVKNGFLEELPAKSVDETNDVTSLRISPSGHAHLNQVATRRVKPQQAFVAMWFNEETNEAYDNAISPAIREAGFTPMRIDKKEHNNKIDDEIIAEIRRSAFVISDFTHGDEGMRGGVYYETGFAHGIGLQVIFTCREDIFGKIHFDTRQYNHISWKGENLEGFKIALLNRIGATIGDGPLKSEN